MRKELITETVTNLQKTLSTCEMSNLLLELIPKGSILITHREWDEYQRLKYEKENSSNA